MNTKFNFESAQWVPFRNRAVLERLASMEPEEIEQHPNPAVKIKIVQDVGGLWLADMFMRVKESDEKDKKAVIICGNPNTGTYSQLASLINMYKINLRNVFPVMMDEWADDQGNIAPLGYSAGFTHSFMKYFYEKVDLELRMPQKNILYPTNENMESYSDMIDDLGEGGADAIYSGPGWSGHIAFIDPCPEFIPGYEEGGSYDIKDLNDPYFEQKAQIISLHPLTIAQNSLHGVFGGSGNVGNVPPKAATIGPRDVLHAKFKMDIHGLTTGGSFFSWQRMTSRMITHGPVTPYVPGSIYQMTGCNLFVSESIAKKIECHETMAY